MGVGSGHRWSNLNTTIEVLQTTDLQPGVSVIPSCDSRAESYITKLAEDRLKIEDPPMIPTLRTMTPDTGVDISLTTSSERARLATTRTANGITINIPESEEAAKLNSIIKEAAAAAPDSSGGEAKAPATAAVAEKPEIKELSGAGRKTRKRRKKAKSKTRKKR